MPYCRHSAALPLGAREAFTANFDTGGTISKLKADKHREDRTLQFGYQLFEQGLSVDI
jgi:hypothetical protein